MEKHKVKCEMIQDLLPLYVEGLTSPVTNQEIEQHVAVCKNCKLILERMQEPDKMEMAVEDIEKIDILKATKRRNQKIVIVSVFVIAVVLITGLLAKLFIIGNDVREESVICEVHKVDDTFHIKTSLTDSGLGFVETQVIEGPNVLYLDLKTALISPFSYETYETEYAINNSEENNILRVYVGERIVWEEGHNIPKNILNIYESRHKDVKDEVANLASVEALQMHSDLGNFTNKLSGTQWTITVEETILREKKEAMEVKMQAYASVLMALIDNLDSVQFRYTTEEGQQTCIFDKGDAMVAAGEDIKTCVQSPKDLLLLIRKVGLEGYR